MHVACKVGSYEVARLLVSYDLCAKGALNKAGKSPLDIVCTKATSAEAKAKADRIKSLFESKKKKLISIHLKSLSLPLKNRFRNTKKKNCLNCI